MCNMLALSAQDWMSFALSIAAGVVVTVAVLLTQVTFWRIRDLFPAGAVFRGIKNVADPCLIFIRRMTDPDKSGKFATPKPGYSAVIEGLATVYSLEFDQCQNIPWVTSVATAQATSHILNVLGLIRRVDNIRICFHDTDYDRWDVPTIIIGGGWKAQRALSTCDPLFYLEKRGFVLGHTQETYAPTSREEDMGLLQKMTNSSTGKPVWVFLGLQGAGTVAASYALVRWWRSIGWLYGKNEFGIVVSCNDRDGWQQSHIVKIYPEPGKIRRVFFYWAWRNLMRGMRLPEGKPDSSVPQSP